jgi:glycerol kinase
LSVKGDVLTTPHILAIDQGTSSSRAIVFDASGTIKSVFQKDLTLYYPASGWVEQDPRDIIADTMWAIRQAMATPEAASIVAAGITNQRETTILWDRKTGEPIYNAIVWQDRRTAELCTTMRGNGVEDEVRTKTGLRLDPYFSATKIRWILDNVSGARERAKRGEICFGTVDSFLLWHLTGGKVHATDATNASRTMLYNIIGQEWDKNLLYIFDVPIEIMPDVFDNIANYGQLSGEDFGQKTPIFGMAGDQQSALVGQGCINVGMVKSTYGTGCFALVNCGNDFISSGNRLLTTIENFRKSDLCDRRFDL